MKNFDVELAKKGWPVVTRDGRRARVICYDKISTDRRDTLLVLITRDGLNDEFLVHLNANGRGSRLLECDYDIFLADSWEGHDENGNPIENESQDCFEKIGEQKSDIPVKEERQDNLVRFGNILDSMFRIYEAKNHDYGDSFSQSIQSYGPIAGLTRISDKFHRLESLILKGEQKVQDESLKDTLVDMANYCVMLRMALDDR